MKSEFVGAIARSSCSVTVHSHNNNVLSTCMLHYGCHMKIKNCLFSLSLLCSSKVFSGVRVAPSLVFCVLFCRSLIVIHLLGGIISLKGRVCSCKSSLIPSLCACIKPCQ